MDKWEIILTSQKDSRMQIESLQPRIGEMNQTIGIKLRRLHQRQKNQQLSNQTKNDE